MRAGGKRRRRRDGLDGYRTTDLRSRSPARRHLAAKSPVSGIAAGFSPPLLPRPPIGGVVSVAAHDAVVDFEERHMATRKSKSKSAKTARKSSRTTKRSIKSTVPGRSKFTAATKAAASQAASSKSPP